MVIARKFVEMGKIGRLLRKNTPPKVCEHSKMVITSKLPAKKFASIFNKNG